MSKRIEASIRPTLLATLVLATTLVIPCPSLLPAARAADSAAPLLAPAGRVPHSSPDQPPAPGPGRLPPHDNDIRFEIIGAEEGLSQSVVTSMVQDQQGFLWLGTQQGLNRYDGYEFLIYNHNPDDPHSLSDDNVQALLQDSRGRLWIGTNLGGLNMLDPQTGEFTRYEEEPENPQGLADEDISALLEDSEGALWVGTVGGGLHRFDPDSGTFVQYVNDPSDPTSLSNNFVSGLALDRQGDLWVATFGGGLNRLDPESSRFTRYQSSPDDPAGLSDNNVQCLWMDRNGALWIGTDTGGLNRLTPETGLFEHFVHDPDDPDSLSDDDVQVLYQDARGVLWIGTESGGLNRLDPGSRRFVQYRQRPGDSRTLGHDNIQSIYETAEGVLWVGTFGGWLAKAPASRGQFGLFQHNPDDPNSLSSDMLWGMEEDSQGNIWIGTNGGGLNRFDPAAQTFTRFAHNPDDSHSLSDDVVWDVFEDREGTLWLGTNAGLDRFDPDTGQVSRYPTQLGVLTIFEDLGGELWIGTLGAGLATFDRQAEQFTFQANDPSDPTSLSDNLVAQFLQDHMGQLWIATFNGGLERLNLETGRFEHLTHNRDDPATLSSNSVLSLCEDRQGTLWVATPAGLDRLDRDTLTFRHYRTEDGLPNNMVYAALEDGQGYLWLSTNGGLSRFDPRSETFTNYDVADGLQSNEFNMSSYLKASTGQLLFGGVNGLNAFFPEDIVDNAIPPRVAVTGFQIFNEPVPVGQDSPLQVPIEQTEEITLSYGDSFFSFQFAALHFGAPEQNTFAYIMEGLDKDWNLVGTRRFAGYTSVPPGSYTFRVKAANSDGLWSESGPDIRVTIVPPFWQTWWFRLMALALAIGATVTGVGLRIRSIERQRQQLERQVDERTRELREAMGELAQARDAAEAASRAKSTFLANMSHELRTPLNAVLGFTQLLLRDSGLSPQDRDSLEVIGRSGEHLLGLINDVLEISKIEAGRTTLNPKAFDLWHMLEGLEEMFRLRAEQKGISLTFDVASDVPVFVHMDEGKLRQVLMNLLGNAVKFTAHGHVELRVWRGDPAEGSAASTLHAAVEDTGPGITPQDQAVIFQPFVQTSSGQETQEGTGLGLSISQQFVRLMGGEITVHSERGQGSTFNFSIPAPLAAPSEVATAQPGPKVIGLASGQPVYRVLVVDDKEPNRKLLVRMLSPLGFEVQEAEDGRVAVEIWQRWNPHVIFMDMRMPVMDGYEATRRIKATTQGQATVIIALTASALEEDREIILSEGCDGYVRKPFHEADLFRALSDCLGVLFLYDREGTEQSAAEAVAAGRPPSDPGLISAWKALPAAWRDELEQAAVLGDVQALGGLIERVWGLDADLAATLSEWATHYEHGRIVDLMRLAEEDHE